jgi:threonylcarbamoyladenosine tRNA methylthiotransferase MtaB
VETVGFSRLHVFTYSQRPGTAAAKMAGQIRGDTKKARVRRMIDLGKRLSRQFHQQYAGQTLPVLWETNVGANGDGLRWVGYTDNYIRVQATGPADLFNRVTKTRLFDADDGGMRGGNHIKLVPKVAALAASRVERTFVDRAKTGT